MTIDRRTLLGAALATMVARQAGAIAPPGPATASIERLPLWPGLPPGAVRPLPTPNRLIKGSPQHPELWLTGIAEPAIEIHRPARSNGIGLMTIPGGGYEFLAIENEGSDIARTFTALGYTVAILTYRLPAEGWRDRADVPLQDAQRAMRLFRAHAATLGLDAARLGIVGFSAGGHLAASLTTGFDERVYAPVDARDRLSARPAFAGLIYPVTTLELPATHAGSRERLLGSAPLPALVARRSPVLQVGERTSPSFLLHALDDTIVPPACSLLWLGACRHASAPVEAHLIERGGHGFGVHLPADNSGSMWPEQFHRWIGQHTAPR